MTRGLITGIMSRPGEHLTFGAVPRAEVAALEKKLGCPLPAELGAVLEFVGNGIFFRKEEILGPTRMMIHDIELLPDMLSVAAATPGLPPTWLPFHRCDGVLHVVDLDPAGDGQVYSWPDRKPCGPIGDFLTRRLTSLLPP